MLASGIHATIAGVLTALAVPLGLGEQRSPLKRLEHGIHPWVMFGVVPLFGFASSGVELSGGFRALAQPLPLAILAGLFVGKQLGIFGAIWIADKLGVATRPRGARWRHIYGASILCGIGFTMSLFIGALAFPDAERHVEAAKLGILAGSLVSAMAGFLVLRFASPTKSTRQDIGEADELFGADQNE
jgi:NhaA family Na+:H+ antiporter